MNIKQTINEINQKPEHIRIRYVWGSVIACMSLIFLVFGVSIKQAFHMGNLNTSNLPAQTGSMEPSVTEMLNKGKDTLNEFKKMENDYNNALSENATEEEVKKLLGDQISEEEIQALLKQNHEESATAESTINTRSREHTDIPQTKQETSVDETIPPSAPKNTLPIAY